MEINKVFDLIETNDLQTLKEVLNNGMDVNRADKDGYSLLHMAVDFDNESAVRLLLSYEKCRIDRITNYHRLSPLHFAAEDGKTHLVTALLDLGADINCVNHTNCTPLYFAVCANHMPNRSIIIGKRSRP